MTRRDARHSEAATPNPVRLIVAARIREGQEAAGLNTEELARETGISLRLVQKHRAGDNGPSDESLHRYAHALKKPIAWFFSGDPLQRDAA